MGKTFRSWDVNQSRLLPAAVHDFVPAGHPARFVRKAQRAFTDPDSRIRRAQGGFIAGPDGRIAADAAPRINLARRLSTNPTDQAALVPLVDA